MKGRKWPRGGSNNTFDTLLSPRVDPLRRTIAHSQSESEAIISFNVMTHRRAFGGIAIGGQMQEERTSLLPLPPASCKKHSIWWPLSSGGWLQHFIQADDDRCCCFDRWIEIKRNNYKLHSSFKRFQGSMGVCV